MHNVGVPETFGDKGNMTHDFSYFSTFSGIGGFEAALGAVYRKARCVGYSEIDTYALRVYRRHFPEHRNYGDIRHIDAGGMPDFDLLVGGFPCQAFSVAGRRRGFDDTRGSIFFEIARLLKQKQPRLLLLENVKGLLSHGRGRTFLTVAATLDELGYDLQWQVLNSKNFGVPQSRERVFLVGHLRGTPRPKVFPLPGVPRGSYTTALQKHAGNRIRRVWTLRDSHSARRAVLNRHSIRRLTPLECERLQGFPDGWTSGISDAQRYKCLGNAVTVPVAKAIVKRLLA